MLALSIVASVLLLVPAAAMAQAPAAATAQGWPTGIPAAPFGTSADAPRATFFVNSTDPAATDANNPNGTATKPRATIPTPLPAGAVVEVRGGPYTITTTLKGAGTETAPVIIRGVGEPVFKGASALFDGTYFIIDGIVLEGMQVALKGSHLALKNSVVRNYNPGRHSAALVPAGSYIVLYRNRIYDNGDAKGEVEADIHGIKTSTGSSYLWIVGNEIHHNGGDSVQIGDARTAEPWPHHIFIGGNTLHEDRENAVDIKQARDVIVSSNTMYGYRPSNSSNGEAAVTHNGPQRVWFVNNVVRDSHMGIVCTGADQFYAIGNVITGIRHVPERPYQANSLYATHAILVYSTIGAYAIGNTIWNVDAGIAHARGSAKMEFVNNIIGHLLQPSHHIAIADTAAASESVMSHNLFEGGMQVRWGRTSGGNSAACANCRNGNPHFVNAEANDFRLKPSSPAVNHGVLHPVYATFQSLYGESIAKDPGGVARPVDGWDIGAYEFRNERTPSPPVSTVRSPLGKLRR